MKSFIMKGFVSVLLIALASSVSFAGTKVSALPVASSVGGADMTMIVQGGVNKSAAVNLFTSGLLASDLLTKIKTVAGAGSGLDADTVDGLQASAFATAAQGVKADNAQPASTAITTSNLASKFTASLASLGYEIMPNGLIIQWGTATTGADGRVTLSWPVPFTVGCYSATASHTGGGGAIAIIDNPSGGLTLTQGHFGTADLAFGSLHGPLPLYWMAIGR